MRALEGLSEKIPLAIKRFPFGVAATQHRSSTFQLSSLLEQFHRATREANKLVLGRSADDLTNRWESSSWSVTECLDHLARTSLSFLPSISRAVATASELNSNRPLRTGAIALLLIRNLEPPYRLRYKAIPQLAPQETDFEAAWSNFKKSQSQLSEAVRSAAGLAIDKVRVQCPVYARMTYNVYGAFRMLAAHQRRHLWQMQQVLSVLDGKRR
jgi:DinB superfamily